MWNSSTTTAFSSCSRPSFARLWTSSSAFSIVHTARLVRRGTGSAPTGPLYSATLIPLPLSSFLKSACFSATIARNGSTKSAFACAPPSCSRRSASTSATTVLPPLVGAVYSRFSASSSTPGVASAAACQPKSEVMPRAAYASRIDGRRP